MYASKEKRKSRSSLSATEKERELKRDEVYAGQRSYVCVYTHVCVCVCVCVCVNTENAYGVVCGLSKKAVFFL